MTPNVKQGRRVTAWLGVACLGLLPVSFLSAQEPKLRATLKGHTSAAVAVAFSPDSKTLASASYDGTLKLWDMTTGKERATLGEYSGCVAFSPDGKTFYRCIRGWLPDFNSGFSNAINGQPTTEQFLSYECPQTALRAAQATPNRCFREHGRKAPRRC